jgi:serine/threonine-protein kinase
VTREVERLYERARELPPDAQAAFVQEHCRDDPVLRDELISLLEHADAAEKFFDRLGGAFRAVVPALDRATARQFAGDDQSAKSSASLASSGSFPSSTSDTVAEGDPTLGKTIGRYRVLALIGRGGMGTVYRAHDERLDRDVALKFLPLHVASEPGAAQRVLAEARAAAALVHPNVCTIHEIGETDDGHSFIAMAFYEGETLKQRLRRGGLPPREAATIARELASALREAHAHGIVHRDVKPGNIMLARDGLAKLLDFGLAQMGEANLGGTGATPGTIAYMSPEQARGDTLDNRSDLWSLGVVLHEMLSGTRPFRGDSGRAVLRSIVHDAPEPLATCQPAVPPALQRVVERLLRKSPEERYPDAAAVEADLAAALATTLDPAADVRSTVHANRASTLGASALGAASAPSARRATLRDRAVAAVTLLVAAAVGAWGFLTTGARAGTHAATEPRSIAVLPFADLSPGRGQAYLADGLTAELIQSLGQLRGLRVPGPTSSFALKGTRAPVREIARRLGVADVLEGTVSRVGDEVHVTVRLTDAEADRRLWSRTFDVKGAALVTLQREIARHVAGIVDVSDLAAPGGLRTSAEVYDLYLQGLYAFKSATRYVHARRGTSWDQTSAIDLFRQALTLDPDFAPARAALAEAYYRAGQFPEAKREAVAALARDSTLALARRALASVLAYDEWRWEEAERQLTRLVELEPSNSGGYLARANVRFILGRTAEAFADHDRAEALDPVSWEEGLDRGILLFWSGQYEEAARVLRIGLAVDSSSARRRWLALSLRETGERDEAARLHDANGDTVFAALARGDTAEMRAAIARLEARAPCMPMDVFIALRLRDRTLNCLERLVQQRFRFVAFYARDARLAPWHDDARYRRALRALNLPPSPPAAAAPAPTARSLAVLPFVDMSGDSANHYFSDGLSEEITTALGRIAGLRVAARSSAFALRDRALDVRRIGDTLGVDAVLEGSVRRSGRRLRVTAQLVDTHSGLQIWEDEYDREVADVVAVQDEIARAIAGALELRLPSNGASTHVRRGTDFAAYDLYLRALQLRNSMSSDALQRATDLLDRAIELEPDFSLAYAAKASVVAPRVFYRQIPQEQGLREVRAAIDRAFAIDSQLGEAHVSLGLVQLFWDWDWAAAERSLRRAIELDPNNPHAWHHLGNYLRAMDRPGEAAAARLRGLALDPLNARLRYSLGEDYLIARRLPEALSAFERGVQLDPLHPIALGLAMPPRGPWNVSLIQGRDAEAVRQLLRAATLRGASSGEVDSLRAAFATGGMHGFWRRWLVMDRRQSGASIDPLRVAALSAMAGDTAQALTWLERAFAERNPALIFLRSEPAFAGLRTHPRYLRVEEGIHFPARDSSTGRGK